MANVIYEPGRNIYGFHLILDKNIAGKLHVQNKIMEYVSLTKGLIRFLKVQENPVTKDRILVLFLDLSESDYTLEDTLKLFKKIPFLKDVKSIHPLKKGLVIDSYSFPQILLDERAIIFRKSTYQAWIKEMRESYGEGFKAIQYHIGFRTGYNAYTGIQKKFNGNMRETLKIGREFARLAGFGIINIVSFEEGYVTLRVYDNFECELFKGSSHPESHFMRGILAGWFSAIWKANIENIQARETKCIAMGDPYCEYVITKI